MYIAGVIQEEFLNDNLLACILDEIKDMWVAVLILIGVPFNFIETKMMKMKDANTNDNIQFKVNIYGLPVYIFYLFMDKGCP